MSDIYPFDHESHYHHYDCKIEDWEDHWQLENCRLAGMPDLAQENPFVAEYLLNWVSKLVSDYNFDAIRIDTVRHVPLSFWTEFVKAAGVWTIAEVWHERFDLLKKYMHSFDCMFDFPLYFAM